VAKRDMTTEEKKAQTEKATEAAAEWRKLHPIAATDSAKRAAKERWKGHKKGKKDR